MKKDLFRIYTQYVDHANRAGIEFLVDANGRIESCWQFRYGACSSPTIQEMISTVKVVAVDMVSVRVNEASYDLTKE